MQRVPVTESQGRIHTSAAGVFVMPEAEDVEVEIHDADLRIDVFRSSGPGGQSVNTTDSAVRITHVPTGIVVSCQNEKSQLQNKEQAMRILRARLLDAAQATADAETADARKSQVRTVDRSERVRTYNFPENRISDHRTGFKAYNLDQVMDGALDDVIASLVEADLTERLAGIERPVNARAAPGGRRGRARRGRRRVAARRRRAAAVARHRVPRSLLLVAARPNDLQRRSYLELVEARARRVPLQHLTGSAAFRFVDVEVGPGVFVPRPETEVLAGWAIEQAARDRRRRPRRRRPLHRLRGDRAGDRARGAGRDVHAVELDESAFGWAQRNLSGSGVDLRLGDAADAFTDLDGQVDVVVSQPAVHPARRVGERRARGARPRSRPRPVVGRRRPRRHPDDRGRPRGGC